MKKIASWFTLDWNDHKRMGIFAKISGLSKLLVQYPVKNDPAGEELVKQTVQIGPVRYRKCVTVIMTKPGLYLKVIPPLSRHSEMLIPWDEISRVSPTKLYGRKASRLSLGISGKHYLIVYNRLFELLRSYLGPDRSTGTQSNE